MGIYGPHTPIKQILVEKNFWFNFAFVRTIVSGIEFKWPITKILVENFVFVLKLLLSEKIVARNGGYFLGEKLLLEKKCWDFSIINGIIFNGPQAIWP